MVGHLAEGFGDARPVRLARRRIRWFFAGLLISIGALDVVQALVAHHPGRDQVLEGLVPTTITESGRTGVVISGIVLLLLARGMARGKRVAWILTCSVLAGSAALDLVKDLDIEQAVLAAWVLLGLWWLRSNFQAGSDPAGLRRGAAALAGGIALAVLEAEAGSLLLHNELTPAFGFFRSLRQIVLSWDGGFAYQPLSERAAWFLGSLPIISGALVVIGLILLLQPVTARGGSSAADLRRARATMRRWAHNPVSWLALSPENRMCWSEEGSLVAHRVSGRVAVALGDPIGPPAQWPAAIEAFSELCERRDWTPAFHQVENDGPYRRAGQKVLPIGSDAVVRVADFTLEGSERGDVRYALRRCEREGVTFEFHPAATAWELWADELRTVSAGWMSRGRGPELGFSLGRLESLDDPDVTVATAREAGGRLVAFVSWLPAPLRGGWTLDMMRRVPRAPYGVMEALIAVSIAEARRRGVRDVSLGMVIDLQASSARVPAYVRGFLSRLERREGNRSLRHFKEKFGPLWEPRYLAVPDLDALPLVLAALSQSYLPGTRRVSWVATLARNEIERWLPRWPRLGTVSGSGGST
jgi:phosphatidylglycerol lysyltransferase